MVVFTTLADSGSPWEGLEAALSGDLVEWKPAKR